MGFSYRCTKHRIMSAFAPYRASHKDLFQDHIAYHSKHMYGRNKSKKAIAQLQLSSSFYSGKGHYPTHNVQNDVVFLMIIGI